jgi:hypothetical protein
MDWLQADLAGAYLVAPGQVTAALVRTQLPYKSVASKLLVELCFAPLAFEPIFPLKIDHLPSAFRRAAKLYAIERKSS